ncbi:extensin-like [Cornus florida]|uniref:extensin-like n=1 Tax=Cornus florida TaxID=4283 RepID=UPI0028A1DFFE|nr:extensin-like [Cornus florida]
MRASKTSRPSYRNPQPNHLKPPFLPPSTNHGHNHLATSLSRPPVSILKKPSPHNLGHSSRLAFPHPPPYPAKPLKKVAFSTTPKCRSQPKFIDDKNSTLHEPFHTPHDPPLASPPNPTLPRGPNTADIATQLPSHTLQVPNYNPILTLPVLNHNSPDSTIPLPKTISTSTIPVTNTKNNTTWASIVTKPPPPRSPLQFIHIPEASKTTISPPHDIELAGLNLLKTSLLGYFVHKNLPFGMVKELATDLWKEKGLLKVTSSEKGIYEFHFSSIGQSFSGKPNRKNRIEMYTQVRILLTGKNEGNCGVEKQKDGLMG